MAASKTIEILIKLKQAGLEAVKETVKQLENLKKAAAGVEVEQINKVNESIESIGETTSKIAKDIRETIGSIAGQAQDIASSASGRIRENIEKTVEKLFTRIAVFTALLAVTGKSLLTLGVQFKFLGDSVALAFGVFSSFPELAVSFIKTPIIEIISTVTILSTNLFDFIFSNVLKLGSFFSGISSIFVRMFTSVGAVFGPFGVLAAGVTNLFIIKTLLGETRLLIRRIRGVGLESLTPIERATRLLTVVDQSINQIGVNAGQIIKVLGFGITTFFAPLLGGIPLINSLITLTQNAGRRLRLSFFAFFGSARAQFLRIFLDLKKFGFDAAASFVTMRGEAEKADKALRRGGSIFVSNKTLKENASVFEGLSKLKLPFAKQFQIAIFEVNKLLSVIFVQVRNLTVTIQQALGLSSKAVKAIDKDSRGVFSNLNKEIKNTQEKFTLIPGTFTRLFRKSVQSIRGFFNRDLLSFFRRRPTAQAPGAEKQTQQAQQIKIQQKLQEQFLKTAESLTVVLGAEKQATAALVQLGEAAKITASQVMPALQASITGVNTQIVELKKAAGAEGLTAAMINVNKITKKVGGEALPNLQKAAGNTAESTKKAVKEVFNLSDSTGKLNRSISGSINTFGSYIGSLFKVEKSQSTAKAATENLRTVVEELVLKFGKSSQALVPFAKRFSEALSGKGFKVDPKKLEESFKPLKKTLDKLVEEGKVKGKTFGDQLTSLMAKSIGSKDPQIIAAMEKFTQLVMDFLPSSPAKKGPFKKLPKSGKEIVNLLAEGMKGNIKAATTTAALLAEQIANYFPRSLPGVGALKKLVKAGFQIPVLLASGMLRGIGKATAAASRIAAAIFNPIREAISRFAGGRGLIDLSGTIKGARDLALLSDRLGLSVSKISALDFALSTVGASATDLNFILSKVGKTINEALADPKKAKQFEKLGIDLAEVAKSGNPALQLMLEISKIVSSLPPTSTRAAAALNLIGVRSGSKIINFLQLGNDKIGKLIDTAIDMGTVLDKEFTDLTKKFSEQLAQSEKVFSSLQKNLLRGLLPSMIAIKKEILDTVEENRVSIAAFFFLFGQGLGILLEGVKKLIKFIIDKPGEAIFTVEKIINSFAVFALDIINQVLQRIAKEILFFLVNIAPVLEGFAKTRLGVIGRTMLREVLAGLAFFSFIIIDFVNGLFGSLLKRVSVFVRQVFSSIIVVMNDFLRKTPALEFILAKAGFTLLGDTVKKAREEIKALDEEAKKLTFGEILKSSIKAAKEGSKEAADSIRKIFPTLEKGVVDAVKVATVELGRLFDKLDDRSKEAIEPASLEAFKASFLKLVADLKASLSGTPLEKTIFDLEALFAAGKFEEAKAKYKALATAIKNEFKGITIEIGGELGELADDTTLTFQEITQNFLKAYQKTIAGIKAIADTAKQLFDELLTLSKDSSRELIIAQKVAAVAQIIINTGVAIMNAFATLHPSAAAIQAAFLAALAGVQIAKVTSTNPNFADGGPVAGPGGVDNVPANLTRGEFVQPVQSVQHYGAGVMEAMRQRLIPRGALAGFASGLMPNRPAFAFQAGGLAAPAGGGPGPGKDGGGQPVNIVNLVDPQLIDQFVQSSRGQKSILNLINQNQYEVRQILSS